MVILSNNNSSSAHDGLDSLVVWAWISFTIQLIRLSIDVVQTASAKESQTASTTTTTAAAAAAAKTTTAASTTPTNASEQKNDVILPSDKKVTGYGSIVNDEENQPLIETINNHGNDPFHPASSMQFQSLFSKAFWIIHGILAIFYSGILLSHWLQLPSLDVLLVRYFAFCWLVIAINLMLQWRDDPRKSRLGVAQRTLTMLSSSILCFSSLLYGWNWYYSSFDPTAMPMWYAWFDLTAVGATIVLLLCTWIQVRYMPFAPLEKRPQPTSDSPRLGLSRKAILTLLQPYFWPNATDCSATQNRIRAVMTWVCVILSKVANLVAPMLLGNASTALAHSQYIKCIQFSIGYCAVGFCGSCFKEGQSLVYLKVAQAAFVQLSENTFWHLHTLSLDWHLKKKLGEVIRSMDRGISACDTLMRYLFLWLLPALMECIVVCIIFASYFSYWPLAVTVFYFVFAYIIWTILVTVWRKKFRKAVVASDNEWHDRCTDSLINFETVKYFTAEKYEMQRFGDAVRNYQAGSVNVQASLSFLNISQTFLLQACLAMALSLTAMAIRERIHCCLDNGCDSGISDCCFYHTACPGMQVGDFVAVLSYTLQLFSPLNFLGSVYNAIVMAVIDLTSLSELLAESPDVVDSPGAISLPTTNQVDPDPNVAVEFDNVVFRYPSQPESKGLKGLSFQMKRGTTTAIVGPTGAGKTTVSRLFFRFYDPVAGAVKVNGVDIRHVTQQSLRGSIGVVPQAACMFNDTIRANLLYGRQDATLAELEQAARDAQLLEFIESLEQGWDTMVGDRGLKLSGGEKQRAAIARCLLKDPPFVILDEATSALDTLTEASVQEALDRLGNDRTVLVIAHRLGTIRNADNIIVLKDGQVHEQGTHDELMALNGTYADMWNMQLHSTNSSVGSLTALQQQNS